jgi:hypothetical protein
LAVATLAEVMQIRVPGQFAGVNLDYGAYHDDLPLRVGSRQALEQKQVKAFIDHPVETETWVW